MERFTSERDLAEGATEGALVFFYVNVDETLIRKLDLMDIAACRALTPICHVARIAPSLRYPRGVSGRASAAPRRTCFVAYIYRRLLRERAENRKRRFLRAPERENGGSKIRARISNDLVKVGVEDGTGARESKLFVSRAPKTRRKRRRARYTPRLYRLAIRQRARARGERSGDRDKNLTKLVYEPVFPWSRARDFCPVRYFKDISSPPTRTSLFLSSDDERDFVFPQIRGIGDRTRVGTRRRFFLLLFGRAISAASVSAARLRRMYLALGQIA